MNFYKYIIKRNNSYEIKKGNEKFGTYSKLTDALYERDRLIQSDWNWDDMLQLEETDNKYEKMDLPEYKTSYSYIHKKVQTYEIYKDEKCVEKFNTKHSAVEYAERIGGEVVESNILYRIQRKIDGKTIFFGSYRTLEEAEAEKEKLDKNGWEK